VTVVVGLETGGALHGIVAAHRDSIDAASEENGALRTETETLRAENAAFRERLATVEERLSALEGGRTPSAPADD
jgi:predicted nuclease with TOPRIM domain